MPSRSHSLSHLDLLGRMMWVLSEHLVESERAWSVAAGCTDTQVNQILRKLRSPPTEGRETGPALATMVKLAAGAGVSPVWLLLGIGDPYSVACSNTAADRGARRLIEDADERGEGSAALHFVHAHRAAAPARPEWTATDWHQWWATRFRERATEEPAVPRVTYSSATDVGSESSVRRSGS